MQLYRKTALDTPKFMGIKSSFHIFLHAIERLFQKAEADAVAVKVD